LIITQTPLRLTLGGGGTDDPTFVKEHGGFALTVAIDKHVFVGIHKMLDPGYRLKYAKEEIVNELDEIKHPMFREALRYYQVPPGVELVSLADIHSGSGLGSSAAFTVSLCRALAAFTGRHPIHRYEIARVAAHIELEVLGRGGGVQDHWACALGDLQALTFRRDGSVDYDYIPMQGHVVKELQAGLCMFLVGYSRDADTVLVEQSQDGLAEIKARGYEAYELLCQGELRTWAENMNYHWEAKKKRSNLISSNEVDEMYAYGLANGAIGGKLVGAGGGGFLMFYTEEPERLSSAFRGKLQEVQFEFTGDGTETITRTP
jgi:D-glycero-alpha-D-manno-heptose-7-phosphate kinase